MNKKLDIITISLIIIAVAIVAILFAYIEYDSHSKSITIDAVNKCGCDNRCILNTVDRDKIHINSLYKLCFNKESANK